MAGSINKVILVGHLGRDPEVRNFQNGGKIVNLRVATTESWRTRDTGEKKERTEWHTVVIHNEGLAKVAEQYLRKGSKVYIEGKLETRKWQAQNGEDRYSTEITLRAYAGELVLLGGKDSDGGGSRRDDDDDRRGSGGSSSGGGGSSSGGGRGGATYDDEIPF